MIPNQACLPQGHWAPSSLDSVPGDWFMASLQLGWWLGDKPGNVKTRSVEGHLPPCLCVTLSLQSHYASWRKLQASTCPFRGFPQHLHLHPCLPKHTQDPQYLCQPSSLPLLLRGLAWGHRFASSLLHPSRPQRDIFTILRTQALTRKSRKECRISPPTVSVSSWGTA